MPSRTGAAAPPEDISYAAMEDSEGAEVPFNGGDDALDVSADAGPLRPAGGPGASNDDNENDDADDDANEEIQDYRGFAALLGSKSPKSSTDRVSVHGKKQISSQLIRKGEKDFEEHGTRAQRDALEQSRSVMESVLAYTRVHSGGAGGVSSNDSIRGWYFPDVWADEEEESTEAKESKEEDSRRFIHTRHRVVMVEVGRGTMFASVGAVPGRPKWIKGLSKAEQTPPKPGYDRVWLLPEEALFLVERGSMELWYPLKPIEAILGDKSGGEGKEEEDGDEEDEGDGIPLSLQAAYSLLIGPDVDPAKELDGNDEQTRGRIALPSYQVYTHLRRSGYQVLRAVHTDPETPLDPEDAAAPKPGSGSSPVTNLWQWLSSLVRLGPGTSTSNGQTPSGPLLKPGVYRSYNPIFAQLLLASTPPPPFPSSNSASPFRIVFHVWKAGSKDSVPFTKSRPPPPDFYMAVADAHTTGVPSADQVAALLASVPPLPQKAPPPSQKSSNSKARKKTPASTNFPPLPAVYRRLKLGRRCVIVSVVDHGIVNYMRFADGAFGAEPLYPRFDDVASGKFAGRGGGKHNKGAGAKGQAGNKGGKPSGKPGGKAARK